MNLARARTRVSKLVDSHFAHSLVICLLCFDVAVLFAEHILLIYRLDHLKTACKPDTLIPPEDLKESAALHTLEVVFKWVSVAMV